ncbi:MULTISPECIES: extracellular solute-binding protein [Paenibacillus]|uniref:ABC transporter substrate-binding protein n=1 Tax=Paenibacillus ihbetae TaxID=1870820 RepID=A0ABX3JZR8_9BACL|nr:MULTISPECIES: extracellular solute-binding protein [Paenibacillus]OOC62688.1 ABC transporter substrate-binding protein [Paenibacillus ihbetae]
MRKTWKFALILSICASLLVAGCGGGGGGGNSEDAVQESDAPNFDPYGKYETPVEFTIGRNTNHVNNLPEGDTIENNLATRYVESRVNVKAKVAWETDDMKQKLSLSMTTGDLPDVMLVDREIFNQLVDNDLIADLTEVYEKTASEGIKEIYGSYGDFLLEQVKVDGKIMGLPMTNIGNQHQLLWVRKDWVDKVGAELPTTLDEVWDLARTFVEQDVSGTGKTGGFVMDQNAMNFSPVFAVYNAFPAQWIKNKDGQIVYGSVQPEMKAALADLSERYKEGLIDKQFAVRSNEEKEALVINGQVGMLFNPWWIGYTNYKESIKQNPEAEWVAVSAPVDDAGKFKTIRQDPIGGGIVVVKKDYPHPEAIMKSINLTTDFLYSLTEDAVQYKKEHPDELLTDNSRWNNDPTQIPMQVDYDDVLKRYYEDIMQAAESGDESSIQEDRIVSLRAYLEFKEKGNDVDVNTYGEYLSRIEGQREANNPNLEVIPGAFYGTTETMKLKWANLKKMEEETILKIIMGEAGLEAFDTFVETWHRTGGDEIMAEINGQ